MVIAQPAIDYHLQTLHHLWLIQTPESASEADAVRSYARGKGADIGKRVLVHDIEIPTAYATAICFDKVRSIIETEAPAQFLTINALAADISGGIKSMTAGMVLAPAPTFLNMCPASTLYRETPKCHCPHQLPSVSRLLLMPQSCIPNQT